MRSIAQEIKSLPLQKVKPPPISRPPFNLMQQKGKQQRVVGVMGIITGVNMPRTWWGASQWLIYTNPISRPSGYPGSKRSTVRKPLSHLPTSCSFPQAALMPGLFVGSTLTHLFHRSIVFLQFLNKSYSKAWAVHCNQKPFKLSKSVFGFCNDPFTLHLHLHWCLLFSRLRLNIHSSLTSLLLVFISLIAQWCEFTLKITNWLAF